MTMPPAGPPQGTPQTPPPGKPSREEAQDSSQAPFGWPQPDGSPVSCREKLKVLAENHAELAQVMQDAFEDAVLMGVDEAAMRRILHDLVEGLSSPRRA